MSVVVPIVHEQDSALSQVFLSLSVLESVVTNVFASVAARTSAEKQKLVDLNARVRMMGSQIAQVAANKQCATCVTSPAKFPVVPDQSGPIFTSSACLEIQAHVCQAAPPQLSAPKAVSSLPSADDVTELFWSLDQTRQSSHSGVLATNSDKGLSSVSSLVPFGSKSLPCNAPLPKKVLELGPQPEATEAPVVSRPSLLFPRSHLTPPSLDVPTDLPLPKLAWTQPTSEVKAPSTPATALPSRGVMSGLSALPVRIADVAVEAKREPVAILEAKESKTVDVALDQKADQKAERVPEIAVNPSASVSDSRSALLREIERRGLERARMAALQQDVAVVVHAVPVTMSVPSSLLPVLTPTQDELFRQRMAQRRQQMEEENAEWEADD